MTATACSSGGAPGGSAGANGMLTVGIGTYPASFNPNQAKTAPANSVYRAIFEALTTADPQKSGELTPTLALSWELIDPKTWQFKLRENVKFSDGTPFTAKDVVATIDLIQNGKPVSQYLSRISFITGVTAVDDLTVNFETNGQSATLPLAISDIYIYPAHQIEAGGNEAVNKGPIGTGPFKMESKQEGVEVRLVRNDSYWGAKPKVSTVVFKAISDDSTRAAALQRGELDIAYNVPPDTAKAIDGKGGVKIAWVSVGQGMMVQFALGSPDLPEPLKNKKVRQALNYAVNKRALIDSVLLGYGSVLDNQVVGPDGRGHNPDLPSYGYDPAKAKAMLAEAGYPNGFPMTILTATGRYVKQQEIPQVIAGDLAKVGVAATVRTMEWSDLNSSSSTGKYGVYYAGRNYYPVMDADYALQLFICDTGRLMMCNRRFDELLVQTRTEPDEGKRTEMLQQMAEILHDEAPGIFLFQSPDIYGVRDTVQGFTPTADDMVHVETISVD
jgi:peptide/nickel transport system substrate-binding protein